MTSLASCLRRDVLPGGLLLAVAGQQAGVDVVLGPAAQAHAVAVKRHHIEVTVAPLVGEAVGLLRSLPAVGL